jgi:hypothetical protein
MSCGDLLFTLRHWCNKHHVIRSLCTTGNDILQRLKMTNPYSMAFPLPPPTRPTPELNSSYIYLWPSFQPS